MSEVFRADHRTLHGLLTTSPRKAFLGPHAPLHPREALQAPSVAATLAYPRAIVRRHCAWEERGVALTCHAIASESVLLVSLVVPDASPGAVRRVVEERGILMRAWLARRGLWVAHRVPTDTTALLVEEVPSHEADLVEDVAIYALTEEHEDRGRAMFATALSLAIEAKSAGVDRGWSDLGVLELPE